MDLLVLRYSSQIDSTNGLLFEVKESELDFLCFTLEDEKRDKKVLGETRIPDGVYQLGLRKVGGFNSRYSIRFEDFHAGMIEVKDVPNFKYVLLHCGNSDEDTGACLLLGDSQENNVIISDGFIGKSAQAYSRVYLKILPELEKNKLVTITYKTI